MLNPEIVRAYYKNASLNIPSCWNLSRKHFRIMVYGRRFVKLNKFENRINAIELKKYCLKYAPLHVYFSVLDWLFPREGWKEV